MPEKPFTTGASAVGGVLRRATQALYTKPSAGHSATTPRALLAGRFTNPHQPLLLLVAGNPAGVGIGGTARPGSTRCLPLHDDCLHINCRRERRALPPGKWKTHRVSPCGVAIRCSSAVKPCSVAVRYGRAVWPCGVAVRCGQTTPGRLERRADREEDEALHAGHERFVIPTQRVAVGSHGGDERLVQQIECVRLQRQPLERTGLLEGVAR